MIVNLELGSGEDNDDAKGGKEQEDICKLQESFRDHPFGIIDD